MKKIVVSAMLLAAGLAVHAEDRRPVGYVGLGYGLSSFRISCMNAPQCSRSDSGLDVHAGLNVAPLIALEAGITDFGQAKLADSTPREVKFSGYAFRVAGALRYYSVPEMGGVFRLGLARTHLSNTETGADDDIKPFWGVGLEYKVERNVKAFVSADFYRAGGVRLDKYTLGAEAGF